MAQPPAACRCWRNAASRSPKAPQGPGSQLGSFLPLSCCFYWTGSSRNSLSFSFYICLGWCGVCPSLKTFHLNSNLYNNNEKEGNWTPGELHETKCQAGSVAQGILPPGSFKNLAPGQLLANGSPSLAMWDSMISNVFQLFYFICL